MMISNFVKMGLAIAALAVSGCMDTSQGTTEAGKSFRTAAYDHWDVRGRFVTRDQLFQNVTQEDLTSLLSGKTFVGYEESDGRGAGYGALSVAYYSSNGNRYGCVVNYKTGSPDSNDAYVAPREWRSVTAEASDLGIIYPLRELTEHNGTKSYGNIQYKAMTGQIAVTGVEGRTWRDYRKGHLQNGIPAAVYTACPTYPSAESLGTFVNQNQTSWNYFELLQQDAGDRVIRPDLVTAFTPTPITTGASQ